MDNNHEEDLHAEFGYRTTGRREVSQREWFSLRGEPGEVAPNPKAFKSMAKRLMKLRSRRRKPEVYRKSTLAYYEAHKDRLDAKAIEYRLNHKEQQQARSRRCYLKNKAAIIARSQERYYAKKAAP